MGYRSDVRITMSKNAYEKFKKYVNEHITNYKNNLIKGTISSEMNYDYNLLNHTDIKEENKYNQVLLGWNYIKWYDDYEEVNAIMDSLYKLEENDYGYSYMRIGEDLEDIEELYSDATKNDGIKYLIQPSYLRCFDDEDTIKFFELERSKGKENDIER